MKSVFRLVPWLAIALAAGFGLATLTVHGCAGNCATNCPINNVQLLSSDNGMLPIPNGGLSWTGPACSPAFPTCVGDDVTTSCASITIYGYAEGECDLTITFSDRPTEVVHAMFGPKITQGCCSGFSVVGTTLFYIPDKTGEIYAADGGSTAQVSIVVDGGADSAAADAE